MSSRILIVAPDTGGHRLYYVRLLAEAALHKGHEVLLAAPLDEKFQEFAAVHLDHIAARLSFIDHSTFSAAAITRLAVTKDADLVIHPDGDELLMQLLRTRAIEPKVRWNLLVMRPQGQPSRSPGLVRLKSVVKLMIRLAANRHPNVEIYTLGSAGERSRSRRTIPDPVTLSSSDTSVDLLRGDLKTSGDRYWFAVVGALDERKNIPMIANALVPLGASVGLVLAGRIAPPLLVEVDRALAEATAAGVAVRRMDRLLSDEELDTTVAAADCVVLAHSNEGSSGIFGKALAAGTRVVAAGARTLRADCRQASDSATWTPLRVESLTTAFREALGLPRPSPNHHSASEFTESLLQLQPSKAHSC